MKPPVERSMHRSRWPQDQRDQYALQVHTTLGRAALISIVEKSKTLRIGMRKMRKGEKKTRIGGRKMRNGKGEVRSGKGEVRSGMREGRRGAKEVGRGMNSLIGAG